MERYEPDTYGDRIADVYDGIHERLLDTEGTVTFLTDLALEAGRTLELGVGTGRVAIPLAQKGIEIHGIDSSEAMLGKVREKPGGEGVQVHLGDFSEVDVDGPFGLIFVVFNTIFALPSQDAQISCFRTVAERLAPGGAFVIEAFVPDMQRYDAYQQRVESGQIALDAVHLEISRVDPVGQVIHGTRVVLGENGTRLFPLLLRYAWPSELDLMARMAGLRLREHWGGWRHEPFGARSDKHVSVYEPA